MTEPLVRERKVDKIDPEELDAGELIVQAATMAAKERAAAYALAGVALVTLLAAALDEP